MQDGTSSLRIAVAKPLYSQVRELLLERIKVGEWAAGQALPNEFVLASEFNVSIGTVRRAVEGLEDSGVLTRKQGRGTFVAGPGALALQDRFCPLRTEAGERLELGWHLNGFGERSCTRQEAQLLAVPMGEPVLEISQHILNAGQAVGFETCVVRASQVPTLGSKANLDQQLHVAFSEHGLIITRAMDRLTAIAASSVHASMLDIEPGTPLLVVDRIAYALDDQPVELRRIMVVTSAFGYVSALGAERRQS